MSKIGITAAEAMARFREVGKAMMKEFTDFEDSINSMKPEGTVDKCEWKELKIDNLPPDILTGDYEFEYNLSFAGWVKSNPVTRLKILENITERPFKYKYRKPNPTPIIRKSGGTWVARFEGVDYLCHEPTNFHDHINDGIGEVTAEHFFKAHRDCWKPISEIEITDEIAKLRPMVVCDCGCNYSFILYGVAKADKNGNSYIGYENRKELYTAWTGVRLATVSDLEPESGTSKWSGTPHE